MRNVWADLRYAARLLLKSPGFTLVALLTLGLGIGANTAIFSVLDAVLLRPLPFTDPERLAAIWEDASFVSFPKNTPAPANYWDWKQKNHTFVDIAAMRYGSANLTDEGAPEFVTGMGTTSNLLPVLGVTPAMGRNFTPEEDRSAAALVIISHGLWQRRFGGDPSIIGRSVRMSGVPHTVIGVMPRGFAFPRKSIDFYRPIGFGPKELANRGQHFLQVVGRLKTGVTWDQARADIAAVTAQILKDNPAVSQQMGSVVLPLHEEFVGNTRLALWVLLGASIAVLLIGCANLANLLMARGSVRTREMALRMALGAGRSRLVGQLLTESLLLSGLGGLLGLGLARVGLRLLDYMVPNAMLSFTELGIDGRLLVFTLGASMLTGVVFGLAPAWQSVRLGLNEALKLGGRSDAAVQGQGLRHALVVVEVAMAVTLVAGAGLLIQTLLNLRRVDVGFRPDGLFTAVTNLPQAKYQTQPQRMAFYDRVLEKVQRIPGVQAAAYASNPPFTTIGNTNGYSVEGQPDTQDMDALYRSGTPAYLQTLRVRLKQGRLLDARDAVGAPLAVVVNETFVRKHFPSGDAVGKRIRFGRHDSPWITIVGVVEDMKERGLVREMKPATYLPSAQQNDRPSFLVVRFAGDARTLGVPIRDAIWSVDKEQPVFQQRTMEEIIDEELTSRRQNTRLLIAFAGLALVLACVGLYGVLSYAVAQRRREIGLRMALGASPGEVVGMILRRGMGMTAAGLVVGVIASWAIGRALTSMLYGVSSGEPVTFGVTAALLLVVALIACAVPARRASRLDPMTALRDE